VNRLMVTPRAADDLTGLPGPEAAMVHRALCQLKMNPLLGLKLWGQDELCVYQTLTDTRIVYRVVADEVQLLGINSLAVALPVAEHRARISAVVLAAGHTAYADTMPFSNLADAFLSAGVDDLVLVVGDHADQARRELCHKDVTIVVNSSYEEGLSKSLRYGLRMLSPETQAVMLSLGNRPFITQEVVSRLLKAYREGGSPVVVPTYSQMRGHPVIFDSRLMPELLRVRGNAGGRSVIEHHFKELTQVDVGDAGVLERTWLN